MDRGVNTQVPLGTRTVVNAIIIESCTTGSKRSEIQVERITV